MLERLDAPTIHGWRQYRGDSLYSKQPFVEKLTAGRFSFLLVAKPGDHKSLYQDVDGLRRGKLDRHHTVHRRQAVGHRSPLNGSPDSPRINFIQFRIIKHGEASNAWVTDRCAPTVQLVGSWKIENEAFNTLKNQGYHLKHNFGHGDRHLSEAFFTLNLLAFFMHQIFERGPTIAGRWPVSARASSVPAARSGTGAVRWSRLLFTSWARLERMIAAGATPPYAR